VMNIELNAATQVEIFVDSLSDELNCMVMTLATRTRSHHTYTHTRAGGGNCMAMQCEQFLIGLSCGGGLRHSIKRYLYYHYFLFYTNNNRQQKMRKQNSKHVLFLSVISN